MGGGVLALFPVSLSHTNTKPDCDDEGNLLFTVVFSPQLCHTIDNIIPLVYFFYNLKLHRTQAGVLACSKVTDFHFPITDVR